MGLAEAYGGREEFLNLCGCSGPARQPYMTFAHHLAKFQQLALNFLIGRGPRDTDMAFIRCQVANSATLASRLKSYSCIRKTMLYTKHLLIVFSLSTVNRREMLRLLPKLQIQNVVWVEQTTRQKSSFEQAPNPI